MREKVDLRDRYDLAVVGGGVHGAAIAWEAALTGRQVCLLEQDDFGAATSANSLKIIHGGLRYLQTLDLRRTRAYAREQSRLVNWFPHLVTPLQCIMPTYPEWKKSRFAMGCGIQCYEAMVGSRSLPRGGLLSLNSAKRFIAPAWKDDMTGGAMWYDAQVYNSERLVLSYALSARDQGADVFNYMRVSGLSKQDGEVELQLSDRLDGAEYRLTAGHVVDASGAAGPVAGKVEQRYTRAVNLVFGKRVLDVALGLRLQGSDRFGDGRLLFLVPWRGTATMAGTWYFPDREQNVITQEELDACLQDLRSAVPGVEWVESDLNLVHVGRLPLTADGTQLLEKPGIRPLPDWPQVIAVVGVKFSNARLVAESLAKRLFGPARMQRVPYGGDANWPQYRTQFEERWAGTLGAQTVTRLAANYGNRCEQLFEDPRSCGDRVAGSDLLFNEVEYACEVELAYSVSDILLRRAGLGDLEQPAPELVSQCAMLLAQRYNWDVVRIEQEIDKVTGHYQRVVNE